MDNIAQFLTRVRPQLVTLLHSLILEIDDDDRAGEADEPGMEITIGCDSAFNKWAYQTGDNSFSGACYGLLYWGTGVIYRDSDPNQVADTLLDDLVQSLD